MQDKVDSLRAQLGGVDFSYSDPYRTVGATRKRFV